MSAALFDLLSIQGVTFPSENVSSSIDFGFETKDERNALYLEVTLSTFNTSGWIALQSNAGAKTITAAMAKKLPGVTAGETINFYAEMYALSLDGNREGHVELHFFDEAGTKQGATTTVALAAAGEWERKHERITVPASATRINMYLEVECDESETVKVWLANVKITR